MIKISSNNTYFFKKMFDIPKIINTQLTSNNELLLYFETGIIKKIDLSKFIVDRKNIQSKSITFTSKGLVMDNKTISNCDLWSSAKFCGWDKINYK